MNSFQPIPCCQVGKNKNFFDFRACVPMVLEMRSSHSTSKWECLFPAWTTNAFRFKHLTSKPETCLEATKRSVRSNMHLTANFWRKNSTFCRLNAANSNSATFKFWNPQVKIIPKGSILVVWGLWCLQMCGFQGKRVTGVCLERWTCTEVNLRH